MSLSSSQYDVIVVGGGHAGTEAALVAARMGVKTLLVTHNIETLGQMSCNPSIGGIGKGHLVKEIDALDGAMARAADAAGIQWRRLNASKGPAVRATRAQADRVLYKQAILNLLENQSNLYLFQQEVEDLILEQGCITGIKTRLGLQFKAKAVVLTAGTFLAGKIHVGFINHSGGRAGDQASISLAQRLRELPIRTGRLKTGTPPRIDGRTIDFSQMLEQPGDNPRPVFSFLGHSSQHPAQVSCFITHTNEQTHTIIRDSLSESPLYTGKIEGIGPRYCPSIEDKVVRFAEKESHQIFIEPEGLTTHEIYPNGISTSLPFAAQVQLVHSIRGLENAHLTRSGYAIEYDFFDPRDLKPSLESRYVPGLFMAGQINGTTGYEEAAAQGLIAGLNAARLTQDKEPWWPRRDQAYLGVLIDDLITRGAPEPYRMFTSRAEYRLMLREDNADLRLTALGRELGCVSDERWQAFNHKFDAIASEQQRLKDLWIRPNTAVADALAKLLPQTLSKEQRAIDLLKRPELTYERLMSLPEIGPGIAATDAAEQIEIQEKYAGYIERQTAEIARQRRHEETRLPDDIDYSKVAGLSTEVRQILTQAKPATIGLAARLPGITPAAISLLLIHLKKRAHKGLGQLEQQVNLAHES